MEGRRLALGRLADLAEHLAGGSLVEAAPGADIAEGVEQARDADGGELGRQDRLRPARWARRHGGKVVDLVGPDLVEHWAMEVWSRRSAW